MARERRRPAPRQRPRRRRVPAGEPLLWGAAPCASCAVRVLRTEQRDGQVYVVRDPGDAGCQRVSHFCGALAVRVLRRARPAHGTGLGPLPARAAAQGRARRSPSQERASCRPEILEQQKCPCACGFVKPPSLLVPSLFRFSLSRNVDEHTHTHSYTHTHTQAGGESKHPLEDMCVCP